VQLDAELQHTVVQEGHPWPGAGLVWSRDCDFPSAFPAVGVWHGLPNGWVQTTKQGGCARIKRARAAGNQAMRYFLPHELRQAYDHGLVVFEYGRNGKSDVPTDCLAWGPDQVPVTGMQLAGWFPQYAGIGQCFKLWYTMDVATSFVLARRAGQQEFRNHIHQSQRAFIATRDQQVAMGAGELDRLDGAGA